MWLEDASRAWTKGPTLVLGLVYVVKVVGGIMRAKCDI